MRYAICQELFREWNWERQCEFIAETGYEGIEIAPFTLAATIDELTPAQRKALRMAAEEADLTVVGLHWLLAGTDGYHLTSPEPAIRQRTSEYFGGLAQLCADLGGGLMVLGSPKQRNLLPGVTPEAARGYAIDVLERALPRLQETQVVLCLEPLGPVETDFLTTCAEAREIVAQFRDPHIRLHQDVKAMATEATPTPQLIEQFREITAHFHANDVNLRGPGMGETDFLPIFRALRSSGYAGWISVEVFDYSPGAETIARESLGYMRRVEQEM